MLPRPSKERALCVTWVFPGNEVFLEDYACAKHCVFKKDSAALVVSGSVSSSFAWLSTKERRGSLHEKVHRESKKDAMGM